MGVCCAVYGCLSTANDKTKRKFYRFPLDESRCRQWIRAAGRIDLESKDMTTLNRGYRICDLHFVSSDHLKINLKQNAVPCLNLPQLENDDKLSKYTQTDVESQYDETVHDFGIKCSNCRGKITGFRYTCVQCVDVELCGACDARGAHADHYVLRIPGTRPKSEVVAVLTQVREAVGMVLFSRKSPVVNQPDEPEIIKPENIDEEAADPLKDDPNARPHKMNILEQALLGIPLIKEECIEPEQFDHTEKPFETPDIKQEVVDLGAEVIDTSAQTTSTDLGNTITVYGHQPGSSSGSTPAKRPRVCPPQPAPAASGSVQVTTVTQDKQKIASQPSSSSGSGFIVMSHSPRNTKTAPAKTSKGNKKKS